MKNIDIRKLERIENIDDLRHNIDTVENYLSDNTSKDFKEMALYIRRGHNFVCYFDNEQYRFIPSKFVGYKNNDLETHLHNKKKRLISGSETDIRISKLLGGKITSHELDEEYYKYCKSLGVEQYNGHKGYWIMGYNSNLLSNVDSLYTEGGIQIALHRRRERNKKARQECISIKGLRCVVCNMDFAERYGKIGDGYIQVHHINPIALQQEKYEVDPKLDLVPVCANCHAMLHRGNPILGIEELRKLLKS